MATGIGRIAEAVIAYAVLLSCAPPYAPLVSPSMLVPVDTGGVRAEQSDGAFRLELMVDDATLAVGQAISGGSMLFVEDGSGAIRLTSSGTLVAYDFTEV